MSAYDPIVITSVARTPMGGMLGIFSGVAAPELGASAIRAAVARSALAPADVDEVIMGCVLPAGLGQAPARQAARAAGLPDATGATTINKMCGSGMKAIMLAHDLLRAGSCRVIVAGGMESMTNAPYLLPKARAGYRYGHATMYDHMALDGLEDAYERGTAMGVFAERTAERYGFGRKEQDEFAIASLTRARRANEDGSFAFEITPVAVAGKSGTESLSRDEQPFKANLEKIPTLKPAFQKNGTITAANSSSISDGAAAVVVMPQSEAVRRGTKPLARIVAHATHSRLPGEFTIAPVYAIGDPARPYGLAYQGRRPLGDQRGLRGRDDGGDEGPRPGARQGERARRSVRARASDRRLGRAHHGDPDRRVAEDGRRARGGYPLHRRRRGGRAGDRDGLMPNAAS